MIAEDYSLARTLQRLRVATGQKEIPAELRQKIEGLTKQLQEAIAKSDAYEKRIAELETKKTIQRIDREVDQIRRQRAAKGAGRADLEAKFKTLSNRLKEKYGQLNMLLDPEDILILSEMARVKVIEGILDAKDIVHDIYEELTDSMPDLTQRDIQDAISGYGKSFTMSKDEIETALREARRQMRLLSSLEDAEAGMSPLRSGLQRDPVSDRVRDLQKEVRQAMKESGIDSQSTMTPEEQWKTSLDAVKTRLRNQIHDLTEQIETGKKTPKKIGLKYDEEANDLKAERDRLKKALEDIEGKPKMSDEQRIGIALKAAERSIAEYESRIAKKELTSKGKVSLTPETPELKALRARRDALKEQYKQMQNDAKPPKNPEASALKAYKTRTMSRIADMRDMLASGQYEKSARRVLKLDPEAQRLKSEAERLKEQIDLEVFKQKQAARGTIEKNLDRLVKFRRMIGLMGIKIIGKLSAAAMMRQITTPLEELVGSGLKYIPYIKTIAEQAPRQGAGLNARAEAAAFRQWFEKQTWKDFEDIIKTGRGELDRLYSSKFDLPPEATQFFGQIHSALKVEPKRAEFYRSLQLRTEWALKQGMDMSDPLTVQAITGGAFQDANRAIFMQENKINTMYLTVLAQAKAGGTMGQAGAAILQLNMPFAKVATNIAGEITDLSIGGPKAAIKIWENKGNKGLHPDAADYIMRNLKKQGVGLLLFALGFLGIIGAGGFYQRGEKRKEGELKEGEIQAGGVNWPAWLFHAPAWEVVNMAATMRKTMDNYVDKGKDGGTWAGAFVAGKGVMEQVPFYEEPIRLAEGLRSGESAAQFGMQLVGNMLIPRDLTNIAQHYDKVGEEVIPREQKDIGQMIQASIPGERSNLPLDTAKLKRMPIDRVYEIIHGAEPGTFDHSERKAIKKIFGNKLRRDKNDLDTKTREKYYRLLENLR
jgi:hypothetical protein